MLKQFIKKSVFLIDPFTKHFKGGTILSIMILSITTLSIVAFNTIRFCYAECPLSSLSQISSLC